MNESSEAPSVVRRKAPRDPIPYDFRRPHRVSKDRLRTLGAMYERLVKSVEGWIMGRVRGQVEMNLVSVEQLSFAEFTNALPTPCAAYLVDIRDAGGQQGVISFEADFAFFLVERLLGARGETTVLPRGLTPIERMVVRTVAERLTSALREIWEDYIDLDLAVAGFESVPEILRATSGDAPVLVAAIETKAGGRQSTLSLCLPFGVLDTFFADAAVHRRLSVTGSEEEQRANRRVVETSLRQTHLPVAARLPEFRISMRNVTSLQPGSILATGLSRTADIEVLVAGERRFSARPARVGSKLAVNITGALREPSAAPADAETDLTLMEEDL